MSFVETHVRRSFNKIGFDLLNVVGDRYGIVQGDGLQVKLQPNFELIVDNFTQDVARRNEIIGQSHNLPSVIVKAYGGSVSVTTHDGDGVDLDPEFVEFMKDQVRSTYYQAQNVVNAWYDTGAYTDQTWDDTQQAYVATVDEFRAVVPDQGNVFIRVSHVADGRYDPYEVEDVGYIANAMQDISEGRVRHGSMVIESFPDTGVSADSFRRWYGTIIGREEACVWSTEKTEADIMILASVIADTEDYGRVLHERAVELGHMSPEGIKI